MCICLITRSWLWCWFTEVFRDTRRTTGFIWVKVCVCQCVSGDSHTWSCINWAVLLQDVCALHEGTKSECEERYHLVIKKLNSFEMLSKKCANEMYSRLNVLVEEVNGLGLTQISPSNVVRKILGILWPCYIKVIFPPLHQHKSWERSMLMRCICTYDTRWLILYQEERQGLSIQS